MVETLHVYVINRETGKPRGHFVTNIQSIVEVPGRSSSWNRYHPGENRQGIGKLDSFGGNDKDAGTPIVTNAGRFSEIYNLASAGAAAGPCAWLIIRHARN